MSKSWRRMNKAASKHRRAHWNAEREAASTPYEIEEGHGAWHVTEARARVAGPFASNAEAWSWIDRHSVARRYGAVSSILEAGKWRRQRRRRRNLRP